MSVYDVKVEEFTVSAASKDPVPGGGGVSGLAGSLAASLAEMVVNLTIGKKKFLAYTEELEQLKSEADTLRAKLLECIDLDAEAFAPLARAYSMPKDSEGYAEHMELCLKAAAQPPLRILELCARTVELDERLAEIGSKLAISDAATSVMLAYGAMYGAYMNVLVNTRLMKDRAYADELTEKAAGICETYAARAKEVFAAVERRLTNG